jgi:hypothetical protein
VRSASFAKGGTSEKRPSPHLHKFPTRSNKVSPRTFQTALVLSFLSDYSETPSVYLVFSAIIVKHLQ